jgi:hypothetical protein
VRILSAAALAVFIACGGVAKASADDTAGAVEQLRQLYPDVAASEDLTGAGFAEGSVTDPAGKPVEGAVVTLEARWCGG